MRAHIRRNQFRHQGRAGCAAFVLTPRSLRCWLFPVKSRRARRRPETRAIAQASLLGANFLRLLNLSTARQRRSTDAWVRAWCTSPLIDRFNTSRSFRFPSCEPHTTAGRTHAGFEATTFGTFDMTSQPMVAKLNKRHVGFIVDPLHAVRNRHHERSRQSIGACEANSIAIRRYTGEVGIGSRTLQRDASTPGKDLLIVWRPKKFRFDGSPLNVAMRVGRC